MASNPFGIAQVDVPGLIQQFEGQKQAGLREMLLGRQMQREDAADAAAAAERERDAALGAEFANGMPEPQRVFAVGGMKAGAEYAKVYGEMKENERKAAAARVDALARVGMSLKKLPPEQRRAALEAQADRIAEMTGLPRDQIAGFDPSDESIDGIVSQSLAVKDQLELIDKDRRYGLDVAKFGYQRQNDAANRAVTVRGQNLTDARARASGGESFGKPPAGYRFLPSGDLQAIPGGPAAAKEGEVRASREGASASFDTAIRTVDNMLKHPGREAAVGVGSMFPTWPGGAAANFEAELDAFKAQTFLPMVQQLRGMGALSNAEGDKLTNAVGALSLSQGDVQFQKNLKSIRDDLTRARSRATPWTGLSPAQVQALPPGTFFINPKTGQKMVRK